MTMQKLKALVIGVGAPTASSAKGGGHQIGYTHASVIMRHPEVELVGAADINAENLAAFLAVFPAARGYSTCHQALAELKPDLVSICTYVGLHREMVEACVKHGVTGILCEKPFVNSPKDLGEIEGLLHQSDTRLVVAHIRRYLPAYQKAKLLIDEGAIGRLRMASVGFDGWDLSEMGSHYFDLIRMFFADQPIRHIFGQARVRGLKGYGHRMEDHAAAYFEFEEGGRGLIDGGSSLPFTLQGDQGIICLETEQSLRLINKSGVESFDFSSDPASTWESLWDSSLQDLVQWMKGGPEPPIAARNAARTAEVNLAAYLSALKGDRIDLPLRDELNEWPVDAIAKKQLLEASAPITAIA